MLQNLEDKKMSLKSLIEKMDSIITEGTKETKTGRVHKAEPGGYGRKDDEDSEGKKVEPTVKRGRGRPKKNADSDTGQVAKYDNAKNLQSFMVGNLPGGKAPGKKGQVHKIKDESIEEATKETSTGKIHKAEPGGYGRKDDEDDEGKKVQSQVKRGRGRPKKNADSDTGEVKKWDTDKLSSWIIGNKPKTLPGKAGVKHKLKDWMEYVEKKTILESVTTEGRMKDIMWADAERLSKEDFLDKYPEFEDFWTSINVDPEDEHELDEVALDPSQVAISAVKSPGAAQPQPQPQSSTQPQQSTGTQQPNQQQGTQQQASTQQQPAMGASIIDFKNPNDPLKAALQQAVKNKTVTALGETEVEEAAPKGWEGTVKAMKKHKGEIDNPWALAHWMKGKGYESHKKESVNESYDAEKLKSLLSDYPYEVKALDEGWGMHESLYQALCDHYWKEGRIPRDIMYGPAEALRNHVESCYSQDKEPLVGEGAAGAVLGGIAGAALGKTPQAAMTGASLGSSVQDAVTTEGDRELAALKMNIPAVTRKQQGMDPLSLSDVGTTDKYKVGDKSYSIDDEPIARGTAKVTGQNLETLPESELEASLRGSVDNMEEDYMNESKIKNKKQGVSEEQEVEESGLQAYLGNKKYGKEGMDALRKAGREGAGKEKMATLRAKYDKLDEQDVEEAVRGMIYAPVYGPDGNYINGDDTPQRRRPQNQRERDWLAKGIKQARSDNKYAAGLGMKKPTYGSASGVSQGNDSEEVVNTNKDGTATVSVRKPGLTRGSIFKTGTKTISPSANDGKNIKEGMDAQMESWENQLSTLLNEGMTITTSTGNEGASDSVSISATDADAQTLMKMLQNSGLMRGQSSSMSTEPQGDGLSSVTVEPVSADEVMGTLEPGDDGGEEAMGFLKRMLGARSEHSHSEPSDGEQGDYEEEKVDEMHNETASSGDAQMSPVPEEEEMEEGNAFSGAVAKAKADGIQPGEKIKVGGKEYPVKEEEMEEGNKFTGNLAKARAAGKKEADLDGDGDMEKVKEDEWQGTAETDMATAVSQKANGEEDAETEKETAMSEGEDTCNECGMYESKCSCEHDEEEKLDEWANSPNDSDEKFLADLTYMTKTISGGLNNMKQDQTVLPNTRVKTQGETKHPDLTLGELIRKLQNIN